MIINHNISDMFAQLQLNFDNIDVNKDMEKLFSGYRIDRAGDDASGLAISEKLRSQIVSRQSISYQTSDFLSDSIS